MGRKKSSNANAGDINVVICPVCWRPTDGSAGRYTYFVIATCDSRCQFRCDQIIGDENERAMILMALEPASLSSSMTRTMSCTWRSRARPCGRGIGSPTCANPSKRSGSHEHRDPSPRRKLVGHCQRQGHDLRADLARRGVACGRAARPPASLEDLGERTAQRRGARPTDCQTEEAARQAQEEMTMPTKISNHRRPSCRLRGPVARPRMRSRRGGPDSQPAQGARHWRPPVAINQTFPISSLMSRESFLPTCSACSACSVCFLVAYQFIEPGRFI